MYLGNSNQGILEFNLKTRLLILATCLVVFALLLLAHIHLREYAFDDAYIHFRIAENFIEYGEPYYNPGEAVMASSSPGWTILLTLFLLIGKLFSRNVDLVLWVAVFNALMTALGGIVYTLLLARLLGKSQRLLIYLLFYLTYVSQIIFASIGLMETSLAMLLVGLGFHLLLKRSRWSLILFGVSVFFRPELVIVLGLVAAYTIYRHYFHLKEIIFYTICGILLFVIYDLYFFGTIIPNTINAKSAVFTLTITDSIHQLVSYFSDFYLLSKYLSIPLVVIILYVFISLWVIGISVFIFFIERVKVIFNITGDRVLEISILIALWGCGIYAAYFIATTLIFPWYYPLFAIPIAMTVVIAILAERARTMKIGLLILSFPLFFLVFQNLSSVILAATGNPVYLPLFNDGARTRYYRVIGKQLYAYCSEARVLAAEIGGLGYSFTGYILDGAGLITPDALTYHPLKIPDQRSLGKIGAIPMEFIETTNPDVIVSYDIFIEAFLSSDWENSYRRTKLPVFLEDDLRLKPDALVWGSKNLNIFVRQDSGCEFNLK